MAYSTEDPTNSVPVSPFPVVERLKSNIREIQRQFPHIKTEENPVSIFKKLPPKIISIAGKLVVVTAFCGPSGAGKSTLFNLITGLNSPTSSVRRPNSFGSLVAIPSEIFDKTEKAEFLPSFKIDVLKSPEELIEENIPKDKLFIKPYEMKYGNRETWVYVADIPDFNSVAVSNWEKTEQMLQRADSIIFVSTQDGYSDRKTIEYLAKVLKTSGKVIYLLTRIKAEESNSYDVIAQQILGKYLMENVSRVDPAAVPLLNKCSFFYSPLKENPSIDDIKPIFTNVGFLDEIFSNQTKETILNKYYYSVKLASKLSGEICEKAANIIIEEEKYRKSVVEQVKVEVDYIVGDEIPLFKIIYKILSEIQVKRYLSLKNHLLSFGRRIKAFFNGTESENTKAIRDEIQKIDENTSQKLCAEQTRLMQSVDRLYDSWLRNRKANGLMFKKAANESDRMILRSKYKNILPVSDKGYIDEIIQKELKKELGAGSDSYIKSKIANALLATGYALFLLDLFVDGALGTLGMISIVSLGSLSGSEMLNFINALGLRPIVERIQKEWIVQRKEEYFKYLMEFSSKLVLEDIDFKYLREILNKNHKDIEFLESCKPASFAENIGESHG